MGRTKAKYEDWEPSPVCTPGAAVFMGVMATILYILALVLVALALYTGKDWALVLAAFAAVVGLTCTAVV